MTTEAPAEALPQKRTSSLGVLFASEAAMMQQALAGRARWFFLVAWFCSIVLGAVVAMRIDAQSKTLAMLDMSGQLKSMSDRQIADEVRNAERVAQVTTIAKSAVGTPVQLGLACIALLFLCWFFKGKVRGSAVVPVAATTLIPGAVANVIDVVFALRNASLPPQGAVLGPRTLTAALALLGKPLMGPTVKLGNAVDFFSLWAALIMGYGVFAVGRVPKVRAVIGTLVAWVCYRLLTNVAGG